MLIFHIHIQMYCFMNFSDDDQDDVMINEDSDFGMVGVQEMPSNNLDEEDWLPSPPHPPRN